MSAAPPAHRAGSSRVAIIAVASTLAAGAALILAVTRRSNRRSRVQQRAATAAEHHLSKEQRSESDPPYRASLDAAASEAHVAAAADTLEQQPASVSVAAVADSAMLRCLIAHRDMQFSLMQLLELKDLARLDASCRSWRAWLLHPPLLDGLRYSLEGAWATLQPMLQTRSRWLPQLITSVSKPDCTEMVSLYAEPCAETLRLLPRCTRLRELDLCFTFVPQTPLDVCFAGVAHSLRVLRMQTQAPDEQKLAILFRALHPLRSLETLEITGDDITRDSEFDFSALPLMLRLSKFTFRCKRIQTTDKHYLCSPAQVRYLAQCRSLTELSCGSWSHDRRETDRWGRLLPNVGTIAEGIGALVGNCLDAPSAAASSSSASTSSAASPSARVSLTNLDLSTTIMSPAVWPHASRMTTLIHLSPSGWSLDLTQAQWAPLARFSQLRAISLMPHPADRWLKSAHIVPPLLHCSKLEKLSLTRMDLSHQQLHAICTRLPLLDDLSLDGVHIEDCAPLALAPSLRRLIIDRCSGAGGASVQFRSALPSMSQLQQLRIVEPADHLLTTQQATPLNNALLARMPLLTWQSYIDNTRPISPEDAFAVLAFYGLEEGFPNADLV